jgi:hypothetical protein
MGLNPSTTETHARSSTTEAIVGFDVVTVTSVRENTAANSVEHAIKVESDYFDGTTTAEVPVTHEGDVAIPKQGDRVIIGYRREGQPLVVGGRYTPDAKLPPYKAGERRISPSAANSFLKFNADGTVLLADESGHGIKLQNDGTIKLYGNVEQTTTETMEVFEP